MALTKTPASLIETSLDLSGHTLTVATQSASDNSTAPATTAYVTTALANLVDSAPGTLNTLNELAAALGDDANFSTTVTNSIATKLPLAGGSLTGGLDITAGGDNLKLKRSSFDDILLGIGTGNNQSGLHITNTTDSVTFASIHENAPAATLVISASGNLGLGTTSPSNKLHVYNTASADVALLESTQVFSTLAFKSSTNASTVTVGIDGAGNASFENKLSSGNMTFVTNGSARMRIDASGNVIVSDIQSTTNSLQKLNVVSNGEAGIGIESPNGSSPRTWELIVGGSGGVFAGGKFGLYNRTGGSAAITVDGNNNATFGGGVTVNSGHVNIDSGLSYQWGDSHERIEQSDGKIEFFTNNGEQMTLSGSSLGIGETSPLGKLHIKGTDVGASPASTANQLVLEDTENGLSILSAAAGAGYINFGDSGDNGKGGFIYDHSADAMRHIVNGGEKMRITSAGNVGIGTQNPGQNLTVSSSGVTYSRVATTSSTTAAVQEVVNSDSNGISMISYSASAGGTYFGSNRASTTIFDSNQDTLIGTSGSKFLSFATNSTERMRISSSGNVGIGTASPGNRLTVNGGFSSNNFRAVGTGQTYASGNRNMFISNAAGVASYSSYPGGSGSPTTYDWSLEVGNGSRGFQITADWLSTTGAGPYYVRTLRDCCQNWSSYHTLNITAVSDRRTKTDIENITSPRTIIDALQGITYMSVNPDGTIGHIDRENPDPDNLQENMVEREREYGYIAQDVVDIIPSVVDYHEKLDEPNEHGWANAYMLRYERLVPVLTEALKECYSKIDALETRITELEG